MNHVKNRHSGFYRNETVAQDEAEIRDNLINQGRLEGIQNGQDLCSEYEAYISSIPEICRLFHIPVQPPRHENLPIALPLSQNSSQHSIGSDPDFMHLFSQFDRNP